MKIKVKIFKVETDKHYFSFKYKIWINGEFKVEDTYDGDHSWGKDHKVYKEKLKNGYAIRYAIEQSQLF